MVFSSPYFIFLFLPIALALCLGCHPRLYLAASFAISVAFYFWSSGPQTLILLGMIAGNYVGALILARARSSLLLAGLVAANVAVLVYFKYALFIAENLDAGTGSDLAAAMRGIVLPAGVSFFVFQAISYLVDVWRRDIPAEADPLAYGAYQAFFPHLIAGPIVRYSTVMNDFKRPKISTENFARGVTRFAHGLFKKIVIADGVAPVAAAVFALPPGELDFATAWLGVVAYAIQIYFDFSGYSDMAIGLALMLGIRFGENFERPYVSRSITEFWRRWHISLSTWFRDYVYIPLGGSRGGRLTTYRNLILVFAITGLWHGAAWTFVLWGLFHGAFLVVERALFKDPVDQLRHAALRWCYCLPVVLFGWVLFRATSLDQTIGIWGAMLSPLTLASIEDTVQHAALTPFSIAALCAGAAIFALPGSVSFGVRATDPEASPLWAIPNLAYTIGALLAASILALTTSYSPFLYFTF